MGIAADALADAVGAEPVDLQRNRFGLARFDLVFDRRSHRKPLAGGVFQYDLAIRRAIDDYLSRGQPVSRNLYNKPFLLSQELAESIVKVGFLTGLNSTSHPPQPRTCSSISRLLGARLRAHGLSHSFGIVSRRSRITRLLAMRPIL